MSGTIAEGTGATYPASVADIKNGDDANEATFSPPITVLTQRTKFFTEELFTRGIRRIKDFASSAAAKAVTTGQVTTGDIARIAGLGLFQYNSDTGGDSELSPVQFVVTGTAGGIWRNVAFGFQSRAVANGLASLDAAAKVPSAQLRGHVVAAYPAPRQSASFSGTGSFVDVPALDLTIPNLAVGDIILCVGGLLLGGSATLSSHYEAQFRLRKTDNTDVLESGFPKVLAWSAANTPASGASTLGMPMSGGHVVLSTDLLTPTATSLVIRASYLGPNSSSFAFLQPSSVGILHLRNPT